MAKYRIALSFLFILFFNYSFAQSSVSVDPLTGAGSAVIPIYTIKSGQVTVPMSLVYSGSGIKPKDVEGTAGMGWNLQAGGEISRQVRGLPDDCTKDNVGNTMLGWMSTSNFGVGFSLVNDNSSSICTDETNDISTINSNVTYYDDTEPDIFNVSAPGLSCQLVYDRTGSTPKFHPVAYQDLIISYITIGGTGYNSSNIASFTITNDKGITYVFSAPESVTQTTAQGSGTAAYFTTKYHQYVNGITYYDSWKLTYITDANGNGVYFAYGASSPRNSTDPVELYIGGSTTYSLQYYVYNQVTPQFLKNIYKYSNSSTNIPCFTFLCDTLTGYTGQTVLKHIVGMGRDFQFFYRGVTHGSYVRSFLGSFSDPGCSTPINYTFNYVGETYNSSTQTYSTTLPDSSSTKLDYWDYYSTNADSTTLNPSVYINPTNPSYQPFLIKATSTAGSSYSSYNLSHSNRSAHQSDTYIGSLNKITYVQGGSTNIVYEENDYYDVPSGTVVQGGGIRVKQIIDSVSHSSTNNIIRNYSYLNPSTGVSGGKPVTLPQYAFTIPYSGAATGQTMWTAATATSAYDLSTEDHTIMYTNSKVTQTGAGSTLYNFYVPATNFDVSSTPACSGCSTAEWYPTTNYIARNTCASSYGPLVSYMTYGLFTELYPFIPNPNYDFERGLPTSIVTYNDAGAEVSETDYTYQRSLSPTVISAFKFDDLGPVGDVARIYNKYKMYYSTSELTATIVKKIYDSQNYTQAQSSTTTYTYGSSYHKLLTQEQATNSDGSVLTTKISYVKDYAPNSGATNLNIKALYNLQQQNINAPVETYQQVTRSGTTTTIGAGVTLYKPFTIGTYTGNLPSQQFKMISPDGGSFTPFSINTSAQTISSDTKYFTEANFDAYDNTGYPVTMDDNNKNYQTTILDHLSGRPTAIFKNAQYAEVAFSDFDTDPTMTNPYNFAISGVKAFSPTTAHAGNAYGLGTTQTISHTVTKNPTAINYIFSIWINSSTAGTLTVTYNTTPYTIPYAGNSTWTYYELNKTISGFPSSFQVSATSNQQIAIDDILFYPDVAEAGTATYDATAYYKVAETNTNGISAFFTNDQWGRTLYTYDQDKNIVKKSTYVTPVDVQAFYSSVILAPTVTHGVPAAFGIQLPGYESCAAAGVTVTWNFGDGTIVASSGLTSPSHTYTALGATYTVSATISSPGFGTFSPPPVNVTVAPNTINLSYTTYTVSNGDITAVYFYDAANVNLLYSFSGTQLHTAQVAQGHYTIHVVLTGGLQYNAGTGAGYNSVSLTGDCFSTCTNWVSTNAYQFSADLSNCSTLAFTVKQTVCP